MKGFRTFAFFLVLLVPALLCQAQTAVQQAASITPNFKDADITQIVQAVAAATGKSFILDPRVRAQVTMYSSAPMSPPAFYQAFLSILEVYGFIAKPAGNNIVKIVPDADARYVASDYLGSQVSSTSDEIVTQVVGVKNVSAAELVPILRPMIPQYGHLAAYPPSNILIISDRASNVHRMLAIIQRIDQMGSQDVDVMPLQNASASDVARTIVSLSQGGANMQEGPAPKVVADDRTNSILISGDPASRLRIRALVAELDTPSESGGNTRVVFLHYADASKLAPKLKEQMAELAQLSGGGDTAGKNPTAQAEKNALVWADTQNNALVITAPAKVMRTILDIVGSLDRRRPEVLVQAIVAEINVSKTDDLGINWAAFSQHDTVPLGGFVSPVGGTNIVDLIAAAKAGSSGLGSAASLLTGTTIGVGTITAGGESFAAMIRALRSNGDTNIVSTPSAVTMDNQAATLKVVEEVPFVTGQYSSQAGISNGSVTPFQTVQQQEVGTVLKVTPTISAEGNAVMLKLSVENSSVLNGASTSLTGDPTTEKRSISTNVLIENGGVVVLGGLISNEQDRTHESVPFLGSIPLIGLLFKTRNDSATRDNLMIFIKPTIMRDQSEAAAETGRTYNYMLHEEGSMPPEQFPQLLRGEPEPRMPQLPPPPPPGTMAAPSPLAPSAPEQKPQTKTAPPTGQAAPAQTPPTGQGAPAQSPPTGDAAPAQTSPVPSGAEAAPAQSQPAQQSPPQSAAGSTGSAAPPSGGNP
ncbi:MAG TPA: type II secretion system secretin GspD [Steroidobacteraceae bacterium]|nr:type II secretion system secretin GspD [Steroidobacteraceae bacterium]